MAPTYAPSHARYAISCTLRSHGPPANVATQSTVRIYVPSGPFGLVEQGLLLENFFFLPTFSDRVGTLGTYSSLKSNQAIVCVDTIKYYSIPSVPSRLDGVKTRPEENGEKELKRKCPFAHGR